FESSIIVGSRETLDPTYGWLLKKMSNDLVLEIAVEPRVPADWGQLADALARLASDDPSLGTSIEFGQALIRGTSERHLDTTIDMLKRMFDVGVGAPQIAYREPIARIAPVDYPNKKRPGATGQSARVKLRVEPLPTGSGFEFKCAGHDDSLP